MLPAWSLQLLICSVFWLLLKWGKIWRWTVRTLAALPISFRTFCSSRTQGCCWWSVVRMARSDSSTQGCARWPECSGPSSSNAESFPCVPRPEIFRPWDGAKCKCIWRPPGENLQPLLLYRDLGAVPISLPLVEQNTGDDPRGRV